MKKVIVFVGLLLLNIGLFAQHPSVGAELKRLNISAQQLKSHQLETPNASEIGAVNSFNINVEDVEERKKMILSQSPHPIVAGAPPAVGAARSFNPNYFGPSIHNFLKDKVMGYNFQIFSNSTPIYTGIWNWAKSPAEGNKGWTNDTRMHIASVSKLMTAIGLVKLLDKKGISLDASISPYIPTYWTKAPGVSGITFRKLLNHNSGFSGENSRCDYTFMKQQVAKGPNAPIGEYANVNFSIMRVLITVIDGYLPVSTTFGLPIGPSWWGGLYFNDQVDACWDIVSTSYFQTYMNKQVFSVAGLPTIGFSPNIGGPTARSYASMANQTGRDGDWSTVAGGAGMYMSVAQILKTLGAFRSGLIMPAARAQYMLDNNLGHNGTYEFAGGRIYIRLGGWSINGAEEHSAIYCLPNNINMAFLINSPIKDFKDAKGNNRHLHEIVFPTILASIN